MTPRVPRGSVLRGWTLLAAASMLAVVPACSGPRAAEPTTDPTATGSTSTGTGAMDCGDASLLRAPGEALAAFPDNPDVDWTARPSGRVLAELVIVSLTPAPDEVGYPEFQFVYRCDTEGPSRIATYALDGEAFVLLATTDALAGEELPDALP